MTISNQGNSAYATCQQDIADELQNYAASNSNEIHYFKEIMCDCENTIFNLHIDDEECVLIRVCNSCEVDHVMLDGEKYLEDATFYQAECTCTEKEFELSIGIEMYKDNEQLSDTVRWLYMGCRCLKCNLVGCYADWKNEFVGGDKFLNNA